jgi:hypothetical protein
MSQPKPSTILLILAIFACVALYVLGVGLGAQDHSSKGGGTPVSKEERQRWRERFVKPKPVAEEDLKATAGCVLSEGTARVGRGLTCQVDIAKAGARVRTVNVEPLAGSRVNVRLEPKGGPSVPAKLDNLGERKGLDVPEEGATLSLTCTQTVGNAPECQVKLR